MSMHKYKKYSQNIPKGGRTVKFLAKLPLEAKRRYEKDHNVTLSYVGVTKHTKIKGNF